MNCLYRFTLLKKFAFMAHCCRVTAYWELDLLFVPGVLERLGQGRAVRDELVLSFPGSERFEYVGQGIFSPELMEK